MVASHANTTGAGRITLLLIAALLWTSRAGAAPGMWTLDNLPTAQLQAAYGFTPSAAWIDKVMHASVRLAQGCSGSFVSKAGLVLTNHHCSAQCIQALSSAMNNYLRDGFLAGPRQAELKCPELELNRLEKITDVSTQLHAVTLGLSGQAFKQALNAARAKLTSDCVGKQAQSVRCDVVELYHGGAYHLYRYRRFQDVRLVWAPEQAAAFFGGDPDNFNFPRFDLDATLLRAYEQGKPAQIKDYFHIKETGAAAGELTFVTGHPGSTQRELTLAQLATLRDLRYPRELLLYAELRGRLQQYQTLNSEAARIAAGDVFGIENTLKARRGQWQALQDEQLLRDKQTAESELQAYVRQQPELAAARDAWQDIAAAEQLYRVIGNEYYFIESGRGFMSKYFGFARTLVRGAEERAKDDALRLPEFTQANLPAVEQGLFSSAPIYPEYETLKLTWSLTKLREWLGADHPVVRQVLGNATPAQVATRWVSGTELGDISRRKALWNDAQSQSQDPFIQAVRALEPAARAVRSRYDNDIAAVQERAGQAIAAARFKKFGTSVAPDATFTLRLSYGEVHGWQEPAGEIAPFTDFRGAFQRHTGAEPYALPGSWLQARERLNQQAPLNFVTSNDIIGGNSGSPVLNRNAELVGLIFDGNIHSLGGSFGYDAGLNRAVAVHPAAIVQALRVIYPAPMLLNELLGL